MSASISLLSDVHLVSDVGKPEISLPIERFIMVLLKEHVSKKSSIKALSVTSSSVTLLKP